MASPASAVKSTRSADCSAASSSIASSCSSGVCAGTCTLVPVNTRRTRPANGAVSDVSIFIDSTTATTSPSATSSPSETGIATTTDGPCERTKPPSSRVMRCGTPWTSTSRSAPWREIIARCVVPAIVIRRSWPESRSTSTSTAVPSTSAR